MHSTHPTHGTRALITAPAAEEMTLADCKAALGISGTASDAMLTAALAAVIGQLDPASGGWLGRALRPQTWELRLPSFWEHDCRHHRYPHLAIALPFPPLISITSVKYDDVAGVERTLALNTDFRILGAGTLGKQAIAPLYNGCWPTARCDAESVRIRFQSGYADDIPSSITQAIALGTRMLMSNGGANLYLTQDKVEGMGEKRYIVSTAANELVKTAMENLLSIYRVYG
jgi:uncharacterized phiE125 gp8 family phage protein